MRTIVLSGIAFSERKMKVLIAIDDAECSEAAIQSVIEKRCCEANMEIRLITVVEPINAEYSDAGLYFESLLKAQELYKQERLILLSTKAAALRRGCPGIKIEKALIEGPVAHTIIEEAKNWSADLIIIGSHGRSGIERFLLGSVTEQIITQAPCSIEVVKYRKPAQELESPNRLQIVV